MKDAEVHIIKHWMLAFKITSMFRDCLYRQIGEALRINYTKDRILNSHNEYLSNCISRLTIEEDAWERRERYRQEEEAEKLAVAEVEAFMRSKQNIQQEPNQELRGASHPSSQEEDILRGTPHPSSHQEDYWDY